MIQLSHVEAQHSAPLVKITLVLIASTKDPYRKNTAVVQYLLPTSVMVPIWPHHT